MFAGYYSSGVFGGNSSAGRYWSATSYSRTVSYGMRFALSYVQSATIDYHRVGSSVRCIFEDRDITSSDITTMQDVSEQIAENTPVGTSKTLTDSRDGEQYLVKKLADGNIWMLDNLRLDLTNSTVIDALTTSNTNVDAASLTSLKSGNRSAGDRYATAGLTGTNWASGNSFSQPMAASSGTCQTASYPCTYAGAYNYNDNLANLTPDTSTFGAGSGKIGIYYNYCAATAGSYCYGDGTDAGTSVDDAGYDICPTGWRLPTGGASGEFQVLANNYSSATATDESSLQYNLSMPLSGYFISNKTYRQGTSGSSWSSTGYDIYNAFRLRVTATGVLPENSYSRDNGFSVRCLAR